MSPPAVICSSALTIYGCDSWFAGPANSVSPPGSSSASACQVRFFSSRSNPTHSWLLQCGPGYTGVSTSCTSASLNVCILRADCMHLLLGFALQELTRAQSETSPAPPVLHVRPVTSLRLFSSVFHHPSGLIAVRLRWLKFPVLLCYSPCFACASSFPHSQLTRRLIVCSPACSCSLHVECWSDIAERVLPENGLLAWRIHLCNEHLVLQ